MDRQSSRLDHPSQKYPGQTEETDGGYGCCCGCCYDGCHCWGGEGQMPTTMHPRSNRERRTRDRDRGPACCSRWEAPMETTRPVAYEWEPGNWPRTDGRQCWFSAPDAGHSQTHCFCAALEADGETRRGRALRERDGYGA